MSQARKNDKQTNGTELGLQIAKRDGKHGRRSRSVIENATDTIPTKEARRGQTWIEKEAIERIGHTGSNKTGVKCSTMPFMRFRQWATSVGVRAIVFKGGSSWVASELGSKSVVVTRL